ncbi:MAG TPA: ornithine cyclodeaminase family protein [Vicinamibacteria bacterium]|nr:ornithine cyclodeaminase family protein [Vicinamibacteria bacterium]
MNGTSATPVRILREAEIRSLIGPREALAAVRDAFGRLARGQATLPGVIGLDIPEHEGEVHVKGAYLHGSAYYSIKEASGFYGNPGRGLPASSGVVLVFEATTGFLAAILADNGYLTELRTGAAGALAADLLARRDVDTVGMIGSGSQARYQLEALLGVRRPRRVLVHGRSAERAAAYAHAMSERLELAVEVARSAREAVEASDVVVTTTPARQPLVRAAWLRPGAHVTAVGSDGPDKRELEGAVLVRAGKVVADSLQQCLRLGEIHHAVAEGLLTPERVYAELGELAAGLKPGRTSDTEVTVADLTGVGVQDAAVADLVTRAAIAADMGETIVL